MGLATATASLQGIASALANGAEQAGADLRLPPSTVTVERERFMNLVRLRTEAGSFIWRMDVPHFLDLRGARDRPVPLGRVVLNRLAEHVLRLQESDDPYGLAAPRELRTLADLALAAAGGSVEWNFHWVERPDLPSPPPVDQVKFEPSRLEYWADRRRDGVRLDRWLVDQTVLARELPPAPVEAEFRGPVVSVGQDHFYLRATHEDRSLRIRVPLEPWELHIATRALAERRDVVVSGELTTKTRTGRLLPTRRIRIVGEDDRDV